MVSLTIENEIGIVEFHHPQGNSLPGKVLLELASAIEEAGNNSSIKVILLKSSGNGAFCGGASFDELVSIKDMQEGRKFFSGFASVINSMRKVPKFTLARVQGKAVGGGVGLACSADYAFAMDSASVKLSELAVGIGPFVVGPAVERKIGKGPFSQLTINATTWHSAQWAMEKGMYQEIFKTEEEMDEAIKKLTEKLIRSSPEAMAELKKIFWEGTENWDRILPERAEISGRLVLSDFTRNAIASFKQGAR